MQKIINAVVEAAVLIKASATARKSN